jgi:hypothetical protein
MPDRQLIGAETLLDHPRLRRLAARVRARWQLRLARRGLTLALAGACLITLAGRLEAADAWPPGWALIVAAVTWFAACGLVTLGLALRGGPSAWAVAREADALGLAERVTSALHATATHAPVAELIERDARAALVALDPGRYAISEAPRAWWAVGVGCAALALVALAPLPRLRQAPDPRDAQSVAVAQQRVEALELQVPSDAAHATDLGSRTTQQLAALRAALSRSASRADAARELEQAQRQLAQLPTTDELAQRRALDSTAAALEAQQDTALIPLARALRSHDTQAIQQALGDLQQRLDTPGGASDAERSDLQVGLQAAANAAAASQPQLAGDLRKAASGAGSRQPGALSDQDLQTTLSQDAATAAALDQLQQTLSDLGQLRATILPANATLVPSTSTGTPTALALVNGTPPPGATPVGLGPGSGQAPPNATPLGLGVGSTTTSSDGSRGNSANASGVPTGSGASPNGMQPYDPVYAPSHPNGADGAEVQVGGDATGARGDGVDLPNGPVTPGDVRPYDQVYAQYAAEARQSAARQQLPPNVQGMVDRYFGAIAPTPGAAGP